MPNRNLLVRIESSLPDFSKGQRKIACFIIDHYDKAAFMTASKLGTTVGVSESTVVRFATEVGFAGYPQLQDELQELIRNKLTAVQRIEVSESSIGPGDVLERVLSQDIDKIRKTIEETSKEDFSLAVQRIVAAKHIYIVGIRSSAALAEFLAYYLGLIFENVRHIRVTSSSEMFEKLLHVSKDDVVIGISFPRYSNRTVSALRFAKDCGAGVIAITDSMASPIAESADEILLARSDMASFVDSLVAPLSLINALLVAVGLNKRDEIRDTFRRLEEIWEEYNVYDKTGETGNAREF